MADYYRQVTGVNKAVLDGLQPAGREFLDSQDSGKLEQLFRTAAAELQALSEPSEAGEAHARHVEALASFAGYLRSIDGKALEDIDAWQKDWGEVVVTCRDLRLIALDHSLRPEMDCLYSASDLSAEF